MIDCVRRLLQAVDRKALAWPSELHPAWVDAATARLGPQAAAWCARVPRRRHANLLARTYGLDWPALAEFRAPAHRLALLDRATLLKVLATCALDGRRESVRRSVGRLVRDLLIEGIGESAYEKVLDSPVRGLQGAAPLGAVEVNPERLAADGFRALCAQAAWRHPVLINMVRLSLPPGVTADPATPSSAPAPAAGRVIDRLEDYFPELAWLFGSDMDRALSVSRTASSALATSPH
ncbi:MAG: type III secretion protein HrpB4 [Rhizobacter sp.]